MGTGENINVTFDLSWDSGEIKNMYTAILPATRPKIGFFIAFILGVNISCTTQNNDEIHVATARTLQVADIGEVGKARDVNLSDLIESYEIIPLETKPECLLKNPTITFADSFLLVGSQGSLSGAAHLYRFRNNGKFLNEIGREGKGPGEHVGSTAGGIRYYAAEQIVKVAFGGRGDPIQLFRATGEFIEAVRPPYRALGSNDERLSDSTWFSVGLGMGKILLTMDSFRVVFYDHTGRIIKRIPRVMVPPAANAKPPLLGIASIIGTGKTWKYYADGNDTLYRIEDLSLVPDFVFHNERRVPYNSMNQTDYAGTIALSAIRTETEGYFLVALNSLSEGEQFLEVDYSNPLTLIDKEAGTVQKIRLVDDVFHILDEQLNGLFGLQFNGNHMSVCMQPPDLLEMLKDTEKGNDLLRGLPNLRETDNPVLFTFTLKDHVVLPAE